MQSAFKNINANFIKPRLIDSLRVSNRVQAGQATLQLLQACITYTQRLPNSSLALIATCLIWVWLFFFYLPLALSVHLFVPATILFSLRPNASQVVFSTQISKVHKSLWERQRGKAEVGVGVLEMRQIWGLTNPHLALFCVLRKKNATAEHFNVRQAAATFVLHLRFDALQKALTKGVY